MHAPAQADPRGVSAATGALAVTLYLLTVCPTVGFGDSGELISAADSLGVAHPPGYPLYTLLGWFALRLPWGEPALRMNLLSAIFAALGAAAATWWLVRATGNRAAAMGGGLILACSSTYWTMGTVTEVYSLHLLLLLFLLCAARGFRTADTSTSRSVTLVCGAITLGVGLAHHPTILVALPAVAAIAWPTRRTTSAARISTPIGAVLTAVLALAAIPIGLHASLLVRARLVPASSWGSPDDLHRLWAHASAAGYRHLDLGWAGLARPESWMEMFGVLGRESTLFALPLALLGLIGFRRFVGADLRDRVGIALLLAATATFGMRYDTNDLESFYLPCAVALALAAGLGIACLARWRPRVTAPCGLVVVVASLLTHGQARDLSGMTAAADHARDLLTTLPQRSVLFVDSDDAFPLLYVTRVLGERPDVRIFHRDGLLFEDVLQDTGVRRADNEPDAAFRNRAEQDFLRVESKRATPIFFMGWPGYEPPQGTRFEPVGLLHALVASGRPAIDDTAIWRRYREAEIREQTLRTGDGFALTVAAMYPLARGERALFLGDPQRARAAFDEATRLTGWQEPLQNYIGTLYGRAGDYARAMAAFRLAVEARPSSIRGWNNLARAALLAGDRTEALRAMRRSLRLAPEQPELREQERALGALARDPDGSR